MSTDKFIVTEHWSPGQYIREYPHGVKRDDAMLRIAVKEYRPCESHSKDENAVTIIAAHGNGFPKECYEAFWDDLLSASKGFSISSIWIADVAHQGASYAANAEELGDDPNWLDHARDLLLMVNYFRGRMKPPFVGVGHSMGCGNIAYLSLLHPRLFHSLILIEPILLDRAPPGPNPAMYSSHRRENWESRSQAEAHFSKSAFFKGMDARVREAFLAHALRDVEGGGVGLSTPKAQESWTYIRPNFFPLPEDTSAESRERERVLNPDVAPFSEASTAVFMRPDVFSIWEQLGHLRPRTYFLHGNDSYMKHESIRAPLLARTGAGQGGSGGLAKGGVQAKVMHGVGHLCILEKPGVVAKEASEWLETEMARWRREQAFWTTVDTGKSKKGGKELSDVWLAAVSKDSLLQRPRGKGAAAKL